MGGRAGKGRRGIAGALVAALAAGLTGCLVTPAGIAVTPNPFDFGQVTVGQSVNKNLTIKNTNTSGSITLESMGMAGTGAAMYTDSFDDASSRVLGAGQTTIVAITYSPTATGTHDATLRINHNASGAFSVPIAGTAVAAPLGVHPLQATPGSVAFPTTTLGQTANHDVVLTNTGTSGTVTVSSTSVTGTAAAMFSDSFADQPVVLDPGETVTLTARFTPTAAGARAAQLVVSHTGTNSPVKVSLSGTGQTTAPPVVLHRVNAGGPAVVGQAGTPAWAADTAAAPSALVNAAATGNKVATSTATVNMTHPSVPAGTPMALLQNERYDDPPSPNLAWAFPVTAGLPVTVRLYLADTYPSTQSVGARLYDVVVEGSVALRDVDVFALAGANKAIVLSVPAMSDGTVNVSFSHGVQNPAIGAIEVLTASNDAPPTLAASGGTNFASATVRQTSTQNVVLTNVGTLGPLTITSTTIGGTNAKMFTDRFADGQPVVLAPGGSTSVPVAFLASSTGTKSANLTVNHTGTNAPLVVPLGGTAGPPPSTIHPSFGKSQLAGVAGLGLAAPTSLQFGPDGRLYVAQMNGTIRVLTVARTGEDAYAVTAAETIGLVGALPNRNDDGVPNPAVTGRLVTGLLVTGTAANPVVYVNSSDPRIGAGSDGGPAGNDLNLDTNSGIVSRLQRSGSTWTRTDLVRGLPRSEENHTGNGLSLDPATNDLLLAYGGNTNKGGPSHNFAFLPEYALSGAILRIDLDAIGSTTYNLPTLDDEDRPGTTDANDPFGGNDGQNMARLVPGGPVQVYAPGFRNPYDLVRTTSGALYTIDNGGNAGWGGVPQPDGPGGTCTNATVESSDTDSDTLMRITGPGFYGGHPNPTRANPGNTFNPANPQSPVSAANPVECDYRNEVERGALASFGFSTNGLDEYTAPNFAGALQGDLFAASHDKGIYRIQLDAAGTAVTHSSAMFSSAAELPLDLTASGVDDPFPGTIWVADMVGDAIVVFEPADFVCSGADDPGVDEDGDLFDNADEIDNGTNPCSAADVPPDADGDHTSDRNDPDDDNDGAADTSDRFARDPANGRTTSLPVSYTWDNDAPPAGGILGLGFTGLMTNGAADYASLFDPSKMTAGGAAGVLTVDEVADGDAVGAPNSQEYGFQFGIDVTASSEPFTVRTRLPAPFAGTSAFGGQSYGVTFGTGTQSDYVKLVVAANGGAGGFTLVREVADAASTVTAPGPLWPASGPTVDLFLRVDPAALTVQASYSLDGAAPVAVGPPQAIPASWLSGAAGPAVGIISTSTGPAPTFPATWDFIEVR